MTETVTARVIDFSEAKTGRNGEIDDRPVDEFGTLLTPKQIRARARRKLKKGEKLIDSVRDVLWKPIDEWDEEELARGRPRDKNGGFRGKSPGYVSREVYEQAMERFKTLIRTDMNVHTISALRTIQYILEDDEVDRRGKPRTPMGTKLDAAKFLIEHVVGKPVQPTTTDISIKLQSVLSAAMVVPVEVPAGYVSAHVGVRGPALELEGAGPFGDGIVDGELVEDDEDDEE